MEDKKPYKTSKPAIDPREFRIGNLVQYSDGGGYAELSALAIHDIEQGLLKVEPVLLTEEILVKAGFKQTGILFEIGDFAVKKWVVGSDIEWVIFWGNSVIKYAKNYSLHNLQNFFCDLTEKELNIKL